MNKLYVMSGVVLASSLIVAIPEKAQAINELGADGVKMPVVSTSSDYYGVNQSVLSKTGIGTQYISGNYGNFVIRDMVSDVQLKTLFENVESIAVNDEEDLFIATDYYGSDVYFATKFDSSQKFDTKLEMNNVYGFIQNTNTFIGKNYDVLKGYDFDTKQVVFETTLGSSSENLIAVKKDIAVANGNNITIYDANGNYIDVLQFDSEITALTYSLDGQTLLVGTKKQDVQSFNTASNYSNNEVTLFNDTQNAKNIVYDATGNYVAIVKSVSGYYGDTKFRLFSLKDNQRVYTEIDNTNADYNRLVLSNNAKFIKYGDTTYNTKNIGKSPTAISIPKQYITMEAGSELKPAVTATLLDGTTTTVTDGVTWKSNDLSVAYYDESKNVFKPTEAGTFTLRASYLGFTTDVQVTVKKSALSVIKEYLAKHTKGGYYISNLGVKDIYLDQRIYKGASYKGQYVVTTFTGKKNGQPVTYLDVARKGKTAINFKQIELQANGKIFKKNTKAYLYKDGYESANSIKLSAADRKWIKDNVDPNKTVTAKLKGGKKTVTIKLSKTQKDALLKGVLVNDYLK